MEERQVPFVYGGELKKYFQLYMTQVLGRKDSTANHYLQALNTISKYMRQLNLVNKDVFELGSLEELHRAWDKLEQDSVFSHLNQKGHNMYSAGFQRYLEFAAGHSFGKLADSVHQLDVPQAVHEPYYMSYEVWHRSGILRGQCLEYAHYQCELHPEHQTFLAESNHRPYMEVHHILPMSLQGQFEHSLDIYANIICLCPICHRQLHAGLIAERRDIIDHLYEERRDRLVKSGIELGKEEFERMILPLHVVGK